MWKPKVSRKMLLSLGIKSLAEDAAPEAVFDAFKLAEKTERQARRGEREERLDHMVALTDRLCWSLGVIMERLVGTRRGLTTDSMSIWREVNEIRRQLRG